MSVSKINSSQASWQPYFSSPDEENYLWSDNIFFPCNLNVRRKLRNYLKVITLILNPEMNILSHFGHRTKNRCMK